MKNYNLYIVVLAAGQSNRMGRDKRLVRVNSLPLLQLTLDKIKDIPRNLKDKFSDNLFLDVNYSKTPKLVTAKTILVLNKNNTEKIQHILNITYKNYPQASVDKNGNDSQRPITIHNSFPEGGISTSIRLAVDTILELEDVNQEEFSIMFMVADQPYLKTKTILDLIYLHFNNTEVDRITALASNKQVGNPVIFTSFYVNQLLALKGDTGGKAILKNCSNLYLLEADALELFDVDQEKDILS